MKHVHALRTKGEVLKAIKEFHKEIIGKPGYKLKYIRCDDAKEHTA